jgi:hypothetical protein
MARVYSSFNRKSGDVGVTPQEVTEEINKNLQYEREQFEISEATNQITLNYTLKLNSEQIFLNGILLNEQQPHDDYLIQDNKIINFNTNLEIGDVITVAYLKGT